MTPSEALKQAIAIAGGQTALAAICGCTQGAVWQMLHNASRLSVQFVLRVEEATGISRYDLRPDIYPRHSADIVASAQPAAG